MRTVELPGSTGYPQDMDAQVEGSPRERIRGTWCDQWRRESTAAEHLPLRRSLKERTSH